VIAGRALYRLSSWTAFPRFVEEEFLDFRGFIFRGQCAAKWGLEPTLDRLLRAKGLLESSDERHTHLESFKYATRGRRGSNPPRIENDNEWWALGQHFGLATPLLDWSVSPFVAAYFAFAPESNDNDPFRAVWALDRGVIDEKCAEMRKQEAGTAKGSAIDFVRPMADENSRLVSQGGLFTRAPDGMRIEEWVSRQFPDEKETIVLAKIEIPSSDRALALRSLNRMNINHLSLFPDLYGASKYCNFDLAIPNY
jgi:hypothetical protein